MLVNHQTHVSSPRICLIPVNNAQPSRFPDGPWQLESLWKQSLRVNVLHLWAFRTVLERLLSALERQRCFPRINTGSSFLSEVCQISVNLPVVAISCCLPHLLPRPGALRLSVAAWLFCPLPRSDPDPSFPAWANICSQRRAPRWWLSTCCDWYSAIGFLAGLMSSLELPRRMRVGANRGPLNTHAFLSLFKHLHKTEFVQQIQNRGDKNPAWFHLLQHIVCITSCWMCTCKPPPQFSSKILPWQSSRTA